MASGNFGIYMVVMATMMIQIEAAITREGCDDTKGCFSDPGSCSDPATCNFFLSWTLNAEGNNVFEMTGDASTYVAVGFSKSGFMRDSDVYACTSDMAVTRSRNTVGNTNDPAPELKGVSNMNISVVGGRIECTFTRQLKLNDGDDTYYDLSGDKQYNIIMSKGGSVTNGEIGYHLGGKIQGGRTSFSSFGSVGVDNTIAMLQKAHGILMIIAWAGLASIGLTIARYFKPVFPGTKICDDKPIWFAIHRGVMISAFLLTVTAFIIIFVAVGGFVDKGQGVSGNTRFTHAIFGVIVTSLAIINPIMAIFRPHPGTPKRPIFNWAHRIVGQSAYYLALITICLALGAGAARPLIPILPSYIFYIMIVFIVLHIAFWILIEIINCSKSDSSTEVEMTATAGGDSAQKSASPEPEKNATTTNALFITYLVLAIVFTFIIFVSVAAA